MTRLLITVLFCLALGCRSIEPVFGPDESTRQDAARYVVPRVLDQPEKGKVSRLPEITTSATADDSRVQLATYIDGEGTVPPEPAQPEVLPEPLQVNSVADTDELTLDQLIDIAMTNNPVIARAAARVSASRGKWIQAGLRPNPTIGYSSDDMGLEDTAGQQGGYIGQTFITGGKLQLNRAVVSQEIVQAEQQLAAAQQRVATDVRAGFYRVLIAQRQIELAQELLTISQKAVDTTEALLRAREVSEVALLQNSMQAQNAQILVRRAQNENTAAWNHLTSVVGDPSLESRPLAGDLKQARDEIVWNEVLTKVLRESPEMASAAAELSRARLALERALVQVIPDVNAAVTVMHESITDDVLTGAQVLFQLPMWDRNQGAVRQARAEVAAAERNIERLELQLRDQLGGEFNRYESARYEVEMYSTEILPKARRTLELVTRGYDQGEIGYLDQLAAQRSFFETNLSYIQAQREFWNARLRIDGLLLDGSLAKED